MLTVRKAKGLMDFRAVHALIAEMGEWDAKEVARLGLSNEDVVPTYYSASPSELMRRFSGHGSSMFLCTIEGFPIGCGGVVTKGGIAEVLKLYVRSAARGKGAGKALMTAIMAEAERAGGRHARLVTTNFMVEALTLYGTFGFERCEAFEPAPESLQPLTVYLSRPMPPAADAPPASHEGRWHIRGSGDPCSSARPPSSPSGRGRHRL